MYSGSKTLESFTLRCCCGCCCRCCMLHLSQWLLRLRCLASAALCAERFHCTVLFCLSLLSFLPFSPSASSAVWVSSTLSSSRAARQTRRRPRAVRMCGPLSTRIHHAFFHHVMCLFDTSFSSFVEFTSALSSLLLFRALPGSRSLFLFPFVPPEPSLLSLALPEPMLLSLARPEPSSALAPPALSSALLAPPALSSFPHAPL